jgi:adenosylcobinamide-phosphate synthase
VTAVALLAGYGADLAFGDPRRGHPVALFGRAAGALERVMWRPSRLAGAAYTALLVGGAAALGRAVRGRAAGAVLVWVALGGRSLMRQARLVGALVEAGDLPAARREVTALVGRDPSRLGGEELCRAAVESVAENTVDAVVAPLVWAAAAGPPGVLAHRAANTLDAMVGHRGARHERFGWAAARLDDAMNWPAARLTALVCAALAPVVGGAPGTAWRIARRDGAAHPSPNAGRAEAAFAGALGLTLGGRNVYAGRVEERPRLGDGRRPAPADVERAARLSLAIGGVVAAGAAVCISSTSTLRRA